MPERSKIQSSIRQELIKVLGSLVVANSLRLKEVNDIFDSLELIFDKSELEEQRKICLELASEFWK